MQDRGGHPYTPASLYGLHACTGKLQRWQPLSWKSKLIDFGVAVLGRSEANHDSR
jgi:hypothetical protein